MIEQLIRSWTAALTQPSVATFDRERSAAGMDRVIVGMLLAGFLAGIAGAIGQLIAIVMPPLISPQTFFGDGALPAEYMPFELTSGLRLVFAAASLILSPICALIGFFIGSGVFFVVAKALGGRGDFVVHSYALSLVQAPLAVVTAFVSLVPCLGALIAFALSLYSLYLTTLAMQSAHGFSVGRAVAVWLIPVAIVIFLVLCVLIAVIALAVSIYNG